MLLALAIHIRLVTSFSEPTVPIEDAGASLHFGAAGYYRTFGLFGRFANIGVGVPYAAGHLRGSVEGIDREIYRSGLADLRTRFSINLRGTPAMELKEFVKHQRNANIGVSIVVAAPTGQYDPQKLVNIGNNRWAFKPEVGISKFINKWQMDIYGGVWLFTENDDFQGRTRTQDPLGSFQFHLTYNIRPAMWIGVNANYYTGGKTAVNGVPSSLVQHNSRLGGTIAIPFKKNHSVKFAVSQGVIATRGSNFTSFGASYNYAWLDK